jgi:hypothetical protein
VLLAVCRCFLCEVNGDRACDRTAVDLSRHSFRFWSGGGSGNEGGGHGVLARTNERRSECRGARPMQSSSQQQPTMTERSKNDQEALKSRPGPGRVDAVGGFAQMSDRRGGAAAIGRGAAKA